MTQIQKTIISNTEDGIRCVYLAKLNSVNDKPAILYPNGDSYWYKEGKIHRDNDMPAVVTYNAEMWLQDNKHHRDNDLPAIIFKEGSQKWYHHGKRHRDTGPAIIKINGDKEFWKNGIKQNN